MKSCPWQQIQLYLMQLEVANTRYNIIFRHFFPLEIFSALCCSVVTAVGLLRANFNLLPHVPPAWTYAAVGYIFVMGLLIGHNCYLMGEILVNESNETLSAFQLKVEVAMAEEHRRLGSSLRRTVKNVSRRMFRRRPLVIRLWFFMTVEGGMALAFLQNVLDSILTGVMMMNVDAPMHLVSNLRTKRERRMNWHCTVDQGWGMGKNSIHSNSSTFMASNSYSHTNS